MKLIPLSQTVKRTYYKLNLSAQVDDEDYDDLNQWHWSVAKRRDNRMYAARRCRITNAYILMHRQILNISNTKVLVDHRDYNGLNNQKNNLRKCNTAENCRNYIKTRKTTSIYKGVYLHSNGKKWCANIHVGGKSKYLGYFKKEMDAAKAFNIASDKYYGEFSSPNKL